MNKLIATCPRGLSTYLAAEIIGLGLPVFDTTDNFVETEGTFNDAMRLNLCLRTAHHVLYYLCEFECPSPDALYEGTRAFPWEEWLPVPGYFSIESDSDHESVRDTRFPNLRCKDAIADRLLEKKGARPDSGSDKTGAVIRLFWKAGHASIYLDTSGEPLCRRGYRKMPFKAPLQETLAAGLLLASRWNGETPFVNPMCGSGTLAIEAALIAMGRAPGLLRNNFAFQHVRPFDAAAYRTLCNELSSQAKVRPAGSIIASDISEEAIMAARQNAKIAGVEEWIDFQVCDFAETPLPAEPG
ncbi:MAG: class I SAM-dependent RNA methyltransferase, partial [Fibrobacterota bacterium]